MRDTEYVLTYPSTSNRKTGNIPTVAVGSEALRTLSCQGCPLRPKVEGGDGQCYARGNGSSRVEMGIHRGEATEAAGRRPGYLRGLIGFKAALAARAPTARIVRFGASGDPSVWPLSLWTAMRDATLEEGLKPIGYTHQWQGEGAHLRGQLMASCDTPEQASAALDAGWSPTLMLPIDHPDGRFDVPGYPGAGLVCPAQREGSTVTCNACGLCDGKRRSRPLVIGFKNHSSAARALRMVQRRRAARAALKEQT